jgi:Rrf2 family transcriptional regulator, nitric oxide-sensitive transcriptional repressor
MRLSLHTDYALRTLIYLAGRQQRCNVAAVAEFFQISRDHVAKVVQQLARLGFVRAIRGVGGGIELARPSEEIRIGEVIEQIEGNMHLLECVTVDGVCTIQPGCRLRTVLQEAERIQQEYLDSVRLSDIVQVGGQLVELGAGPQEFKGQRPNSK